MGNPIVHAVIETVGHGAPGGIVYVLTLKTWAEYDRAHHWYGRIHWEVPAPCDHHRQTYRGDSGKCDTCGADFSKVGFHSDDTTALPDGEGFASCRHDTRASAVDGALRWFAQHGTADDSLVLGTWGLCGWESDWPWELLAGKQIVVKL